MLSYLRKPYPLSEQSPLRILVTGAAAGAFVAAFLILFQPFGTDDVNFPRKNLFLAGYGLIVAVVIWFFVLIPATIFRAEEWTIGKQLAANLLAALLGISISYFYLLLLGGSASWYSYRIFVVNAIKVAIFPMVGITLADYILKLKHYARGAQAFNEKMTAASKQLDIAPAAAPPPGSELQILDEQERPLLSLPTDNIWCLRSDRNYVDIFHRDATGEVVKTTVRNTLTKLSEELPATFLRCHRSYVINAARVESVTGNAQGYQLHSSLFPDVPVPVSRGKSAEILGFIRE